MICGVYIDWRFLMNRSFQVEIEPPLASQLVASLRTKDFAALFQPPFTAPQLSGVRRRSSRDPGPCRLASAPPLPVKLRQVQYAQVSIQKSASSQAPPSALNVLCIAAGESYEETGEHFGCAPPPLRWE
jgi:hypothetical protein